MLVSGGKLLAIDKVNTDDFTVSGDGVEQALSVNTDIIATNTVVDSVSSILQSDIQAVSSNFDNYYTKSETSGSEQLAEEFDSIKSSIQNYDLVSLTPDNLYAGISADSQNKNVYVVSATDAQDKLEFDGVYDPETNKVATVETVNDAVKTVKPIILEYNKTVDYTWEELQNTAPNVYATTDGSALFNLAVVNENEMIFRQHAAAKIGSDEHSQIHVTELQLFRNLNWNTEAITYDVSDPWSDNGTGISVSTGRISVNVDDSTIKINESNQLYAVDNFQHVNYEVTQWADIDFSKNLLLHYISHDTVIATATYTADDTSLKFYACIDGKVYIIQLLHDTNEWSATVLDTSETYTAVWHQTTLDELNQLDTDVIVFVMQDEATLAPCTFRSSTEWRFANTTGDKAHEMTVTASGWTEAYYDCSNTCVIQYGDASKSLTDLKQYDTVLMQMNSKTFYLTELTDSNAHFMSCYQINGEDTIETCDYDGLTWTDISTVNFDIGTVIVSSTDVASLTQSYDELKALTQNGRLYMTYEDTLMQAVFANDSAKQIVFGCTYRSPDYILTERWLAFTIVIEYSDEISRWTTTSTTGSRLQHEVYARKGLEMTDYYMLDIKPDSSLTFDSSDRLKLNYTTIEVDE